MHETSVFQMGTTFAHNRMQKHKHATDSDRENMNLSLYTLDFFSLFEEIVYDR